MTAPRAIRGIVKFADALVVGLSPCLFAAVSGSKLWIETISPAMLPFYAIQVVFLLMRVLMREISLAPPRMAGFNN
ncbi:MAG: hypothetical protein CML23_19020 [Rhizobiaceae bacterium]|nr:hypothetical protein [Rhizobiaceae bacterium]|tara:strand:- start:1070 stop:1297 length:228 start_codon:yes stop_codon:yes gene_type:complete